MSHPSSSLSETSLDLRWLDDEDDLSTWLGRREAEALALDTESDHGSRTQVCLIQLACRGDEVALIDPFEWDAGELEPLWEVLADASRSKILHAAPNDLEEMDSDWGIEIHNVFDTRTAVRFLGSRRSGLEWLLKDWLDVDVPDDYGRFDWSRRPLPPRAVEYAATDVQYLHTLRDRLAEQLRGTGRWEAFRQQSEYLAREAVYDTDDLDPEGWRDIDRGPNLDGPGRRALRELHAWRHRTCERQNRAPEHVLNDDAMAHLANHRPTSLEELKSVTPVPDDAIETHGAALVEAIRRAEGKDIPSRRSPERSSYTSMTSTEEARYDALRAWRNDEAEALDLPEEFVATNDTLEYVARRSPETLDELKTVDEMLPWHLEMLGEKLLDVVQRY